MAIILNDADQTHLSTLLNMRERFSDPALNVVLEKTLQDMTVLITADLPVYTMDKMRQHYRRTELSGRHVLHKVEAIRAYRTEHPNLTLLEAKLQFDAFYNQHHERIDAELQRLDA